MEKLPDLLVKPEPWSGLLMGNHALVRAMFESGVGVATTYPGSPTPEIADAILSVPESERPLYFQFSTNEKVALEVALGASVNGHLSCVFFKSVGLNVASDSAIQLAHFNLVGGMVVILGDDPGANSSQNEQDNRYFARQSYTPLFEPATPAESYKMFLEAAAIARDFRMPVLFRMTTHVCHARQMVQFGSYAKPPDGFEPIFSLDNGPYVPLASDVFPMKNAALDKIEKVRALAEKTDSNPLFTPNGTNGQGEKKLGLISASMPALSLLENLVESGQRIDLMKLGLSFPLPEKKIIDFLNSHDEVLIVEELDRVMEFEIKALALDNKVQSKVAARVDREDMMGELGPERTWKLLSQTWPSLFEEKPIPKPLFEISPRLPQMCPGCGHRAAFFGVKAVLPENAITVADIGCHSMGYYPPHNMGQILVCMGASNGVAGGMTIGNESRKIISFIGDSTFFHAGIPAIINAVLYDFDFTLVVMENGTTAMTGHQPHAASGEISDKIPIKKVLETFGVKFLRDVDAYDQKALQTALTESMEYKGFSIVIARHPCMLKFTRQQRKKGAYNPLQMQVQENCDQSYVCLSDFACPSFVSNDDGSVSVNHEICIGDGSCIAVCPVKALKFPRREKE